MDLIDDLITVYLQFPLLDRVSVLFGLICLGGLLGAFAGTGHIRLQRSAYFGLCMVALALVLVQPVAYADFTQARPRRPWLTIGAAFAMAIGTGAATVTLAKFRALDATGGKGWAVLAFVPIANLVLFLAPSRSRRTYTREDSLDLLDGVNGIIVGLVALATVFTAQHALTVGKTTRLAQPGARVENTIALIDLRDTLEDVAERMSGRQSDGPFDLLRVAAIGTRLEFHWMPKLPTEWPLPPEAHAAVTSGVCNDQKLLAPLVAEGAEVAFLYYGVFGGKVDEVIINKDACGL